MNGEIDIAAMARQLEEVESFVPTVYKDSLGYDTIAIGRCVDRRVPGAGVRRVEGVFMLGNDIEQGVGELHTQIGWWMQLSEVRRRVLLDMWFNMGWGKLSQFKQTLALVQAGRYSDAATAMRHSKWYGQVGKRAERLARMMEFNHDVAKWW